MAKYSGLQNVIFGNAIRKLICIVAALFFLQSLAFSQAIDSPMHGYWFEVQKKHRKNAIPLQIQLKEDSSAVYVNRYPEKSYNLKWTVTPDSMLQFTNGERYKIVSVSSDRIKLRRKKAPNGNNIVLKRVIKMGGID